MVMLLLFAVIALIFLVVFFSKQTTSKNHSGKIIHKKVMESATKNIVIKKAKTEKWMDNKWDEESKVSMKNKR